MCSIDYNRGWTNIDHLIIILKDCKKKKDYPHLKSLFLMIPYYRDIIMGKGERDISYRIIYAWYQVFPVLALKAIHLLFFARFGTSIPIGSWCDVKYFCLLIEKISPLGLYDPLISVVVSIANRQLYIDLSSIDDCISNVCISNVSKWIPRESHHSDLFSIFVRDWFSLHYIDSAKKKLYRQIISRLSCINSGILSSGNLSIKAKTKMFMCDFVRSAIRCIHLDPMSEDVISINHKWNHMLRTFTNGPSGLPLVDIDISLSDEQLFNALGFACFIAQKMGLKRILLAGPSLLCVDISSCRGFVSIIALLWSHCELRGKSNLTSALYSIESGFDYDLSLRLFIFSNNFDVKSDNITLLQNIEVIFWNLSPSIQYAPFGSPAPDSARNEWSAIAGGTVTFHIEHVKRCNNDLSTIDIDNIIYMSGYSPNLMTPFLSFEKFSLEHLLHNQYPEWVDYFDLFIQNVM